MERKGVEWTIRQYESTDDHELKELLRSEGDAWGDYLRDGAWERYLDALRGSVVFVGIAGGVLGGFVRARDDGGFGVYVYDLLVHRRFRGNGAGRELLERVRREYSGCPVHVMSDVDGYYEKLGYTRAGSVFRV